MSTSARDGARTLPLPTPRGPVSEALLALLVLDPVDAPQSARDTFDEAVRSAPAVVDPDVLLTQDHDVQLALFCLYELHYRGIEGVSDDWEWDASLLAARAVIERAFEAELRSRVELPELPAPDRASDVSPLDFATTRSATSSS